MELYRIVKDKSRTSDLSGTGAYRPGGRWNNKNTYMLYTCANSSLALLENLVHFDDIDYPPQLFIMQLEISDTAPIYTLPNVDYPPNWQVLGLLENKAIGDKFINENKYLAMKVRSAINVMESNFLLNPLFPRYYDLVKVIDVKEIDVDERLVK